VVAVGIVLLGYPALKLRADEIYKSIDADGHVVYSDHVDPSLSQTSVVHLDDPRYPPHEMHFCWTNCFTLIFDDGVYRRADGTDETWTVESFTPKAFVLHRHDVAADRNGATTDVVYAGQLANDRLLGVTVNGKPTSGIDASWGIALNTLPGSNAERDAPGATVPTAAPLRADSAVAADAAASSAVPPPPLPPDSQPVIPEDGDLWTPGYWNWRGQAYAWVPGAWVQPPRSGLLWTPAYWASAGSVYVFHPGYWGPHVGFYGGINYGFGYFGSGYCGGRWVGGSFAYNSSVNHLNARVIHNTYQEAVANPSGGTRVSYNGGSGGATAVPAAAEMLAGAEAQLPSKAYVAYHTNDASKKAAAAPRAMVVASSPTSPSSPSSATATPRTVEPRSTPTPPKAEPAPAPKHNAAPSVRPPPKP
jgi:hypothetical protein